MFYLTREQKISNLEEQIKFLQTKKENLEKEIQKRKNALDRQRNLLREESTKDSHPKTRTVSVQSTTPESISQAISSMAGE